MNPEMEMLWSLNVDASDSISDFRFTTSKLIS